jgi:hypothetical protein
MRYRKTDLNFPFASSVLGPCVINFLTATMMLQAFTMAFALLLTTFVPRSIKNLGNDLFPVLGVVTYFRCCRPTAFLFYIVSRCFVSRCFSPNGFPRLKCGLALPLASFRCRTHEWLLL